jgi:hypothetical protein
MGWPLRMFQEEGYYFVTSRCFQGRLLLRPSVEVNEVVGGVLARAVQQSGGTVRLYAFTFASNHFHLLVWARGAALAGFMQYLRANLSKDVLHEPDDLSRQPGAGRPGRQGLGRHEGF